MRSVASLNTIAACELEGVGAFRCAPEGFVDKSFRCVGFHGQPPIHDLPG